VISYVFFNKFVVLIIYFILLYLFLYDGACGNIKIIFVQLLIRTISYHPHCCNHDEP